MRQQSVAATFKGQLTSLIETLGETSVHYVRCIKPNSKQVPNNFKSDLVLDQLKCCGVFEVGEGFQGFLFGHSQEVWNRSITISIWFDEAFLARRGVGQGGATSKALLEE